MRLIQHLLQRIQLPRWSTLLATLFYLMFVLFILNLSFPLRSPTLETAVATGHGDNMSELDQEVEFSAVRKKANARQIIELKEAFFR